MHDSRLGSARHRVVVCTECQRRSGREKIDRSLIQRIQRALDAESLSVGNANGFDVTGEACLAGCDYPCTVAYLGDGKTSYLFGGIDSDADIAALVAFADQYRRSDTGR